MSINIDDLKKDLKNNPVFNMSLSGKEVFHSNVLAWLLSETNNNDEATSTAKALTKLFPPKDLKADEKAEEKYRVLTVFREKNDFDLLNIFYLFICFRLFYYFVISKLQDVSTTYLFRCN